MNQNEARGNVIEKLTDMTVTNLVNGIMSKKSPINDISNLMVMSVLYLAENSEKALEEKEKVSAEEALECMELGADIFKGAVNAARILLKEKTDNVKQFRKAGEVNV